MPTNRSGVRQLLTKIKRERSFDYNLVVAVAPDGALELGNLRISAQEYDEALLILVSEVIDSSPDESELLFERHLELRAAFDTDGSFHPERDCLRDIINLDKLVLSM